MKQGTADSIAVLAPVPEEHLIDGAEVCVREGKIAYGSRAFEMFVQLDSLRAGEPVDVHIYASHVVRDGPARATWAATYIGFVPSPDGSHPDGPRYRPESTFKYPTDNKGHWALFWEVTGLRKLPDAESLLIRDMRGWKSKTKYDKFFVPEGPLIIERP
jgi:hypothetical protein